MIHLIESLKIELIVILFSMLPIFELRGAIPLGISLGLSPIHSTILSIFGNILIVPLLLRVLYPTMEYFEKTTIFKKTIGWVKTRSMKRSGTIKRYSVFGLYLFVAIPLPTTGIWTGTVIASILHLDRKKAFIAMALGIVTAGILMLLISYGFLGVIK